MAFPPSLEAPHDERKSFNNAEDFSALRHARVDDRCSFQTAHLTRCAMLATPPSQRGRIFQGTVRISPK